MSCYIVENNIIVDVLIGIRKYTNYFRGKTLSEQAQMLLDENYDSVNARYGEDSIAPRVNLNSDSYLKHEKEADNLDIYSAIRCYMYQCDNAEDWDNSDIKYACEQALNEMLKQTLEDKFNREMTWG